MVQPCHFLVTLTRADNSRFLSAAFGASPNYKSRTRPWCTQNKVTRFGGWMAASLFHGFGPLSTTESLSTSVLATFAYYATNDSCFI